MTTKFTIRVRDGNGAYTTNTVKGKRASCTHSAEVAAQALARKVAAAKRWTLGQGLRDGAVTVYELEVA